MSEVLGLAWEDLHLDAGTAQIRRGASYTSSVGMVLGSTKTSGAEGVHHLAPVSVAHVRKRRAEQQLEARCDGYRVARARLRRREAVHGAHCGPRAVSRTARPSRRRSAEHAKVAGLDPEGLASHNGRRTVVTALHADGGWRRRTPGPDYLIRPMRQRMRGRVRSRSGFVPLFGLSGSRRSTARVSASSRACVSLSDV